MSLDQRDQILHIWKADKEGTVTITASIENGENSQIKIDVVVVENPLPDLIIEDVSARIISQPQEGKPLNFTVKVKNQGDAAPSGAALAKYILTELLEQDIHIPLFR